MQDRIPSRTAWRVAARRAAHQLFDTPRVFEDPLALRILGAEGALAVERESADREDTRVARALRAFMAVRSRFAEDELAQAVGQGVRQLVSLGAGLDTFAYRHPFSDDVRIFEVDHPATQAWKRDLLDQAAIGIPASVAFVPVDFERQAFMEALGRGGFDGREAAFFSWLGVTMYLTRDTAMDVFRSIASLPAPSGVAFDYAVSPALLGPIERWAVHAFSRRVAAIGEPWTLFFDPFELEADLRAVGFSEVADFGAKEINARFFSDRTDRLKVGSLGRLMKARR
jgi:methyltransferase (TIGR00027 family)